MIPRAAERKRRLEASYEAAAAERRNRPTRLVVIAALLLLAALVYLALAASRRAEAAGNLRGAESAMQRLVNIRAEIEAYQDNDAQRALRQQFAPRMRSIRSTLDRIATELGMEEPPQLGQITDERRLGLDSKLLLRTIDVTLTEADTDLALQWIQQATQDVEGLFVSGVTLNPGPDAWRVTVKLSRWEIDQ